MSITIIGAGLAGCEAAWQLANRNISVKLIDMKPHKRSPAHLINDYAELVCSNSLRSDSLSNAVGLLKEEMRRLGSLIIQCADETRVPAGSALAVDRKKFSMLVTKRIKNHPNIICVETEATQIPEGKVIIATGPLTSEAMVQEISKLNQNIKMLSFYDAAAPIVTFESIDMREAFFASRYDKGDADYINCPMNAEQYRSFRNELINAERAQLRDFEQAELFEGCLPIEIMAERGEDTMRFGPLKPVGLIDPKTGKESFSVVQLRKDNIEGSLYNLVGFQTNLKFSQQQRVFSMIPGLRNAEFVRYGVMHKNTYVDSPRILDRYNRLRDNTRICFAGQITGVEGYVESAASGLITGIEAANEIQGKTHVDFPKCTAIGALALYTSGGSVSDFQPMNINFGLMDMPKVKIKSKRERSLAISSAALLKIDTLVLQI